MFYSLAVLQIRRSNRYNLEIIFHISPKNIFWDPSLEPSHRDGSNEGSQHMFSLKNKKNYLWIIPVTPSYLELWSCETNGTFSLLATIICGLHFEKKMSEDVWIYIQRISVWIGSSYLPYCMGLLLKERICSLREQILSFKSSLLWRMDSPTRDVYSLSYLPV